MTNQAIIDDQEQRAGILVVDDEEVMRKSLTDIMRLSGYRVENAANAQEAIGILKRNSFDVILLDLRMPVAVNDPDVYETSFPGMTDEQAGINVLRFVAEQAKDTQVIILTAHGSMDTAITALRLSALDYLLKPVPPIEILSAVKKALQRRNEILSSRARETALNTTKMITLQMDQSLNNLENSLQALRVIAERNGQSQLGQGVTGAEKIPSQESSESSQLSSPTVIYQLKPGLMIDLLRREIWQTIQDLSETNPRKNVVRLSLTPTEGKLMKVFAENIGKVIPHNELVTYVQGTEILEMEAPEVLRPFISRLRRKLGVFPHGRAWIRSIRGTGYMFDPELEH